MITDLILGYCAITYGVAVWFVLSELFGFYRPESFKEWIRLILLVLFAPVTVPLAVIIATVVSHMYFR